ncbi:MAG: hypothetical protein INR71_13705 [Terriglobus roseus]|nr:hypothetical protein [Terriglobus roseus]
MNKTDQQGAWPLPEGTSALQEAVSRALAQQPRVKVPDSFASRVARQALELHPLRSRQRVGWGPRVALGSAALLTVGLFALAPHASPSFSNMSFDGQLIFLAELGALLLFSRQLLLRD